MFILDNDELLERNSAFRLPGGWWRVWRAPKHDVKNYAICMHTSRRQLSSLCYLLATRNGRVLFTQSWRSNNSSGITTAWNVKILHVMGSLKKSHENSTQLPYSVWGGWGWLTRANNYWRWKLDPFLWARKKISEYGSEKKRGRSAKKTQEWVVYRTGDVNGFFKTAIA